MIQESSALEEPLIIRDIGQTKVTRHPSHGDPRRVYELRDPPEPARTASEGTPGSHSVPVPSEGQC